VNTLVTARPVPAAHPGEPAARGGRAGRDSRGGRAGWLAAGLVIAGLAMIPWLFVLASQLPAATLASHWPAAWVGLDSLEALGLLSTGLLLARRDGRYRLTAAATAALLVTDAWFDVLTSAPGRDQLIALAMAACPELPVAALCAVLALRGGAGRPGNADLRP
jgi:hypothetical protein